MRLTSALVEQAFMETAPFSWGVIGNARFILETGFTEQLTD